MTGISCALQRSAGPVIRVAPWVRQRAITSLKILTWLKSVKLISAFWPHCWYLLCRYELRHGLLNQEYRMEKLDVKVFTLVFTWTGRRNHDTHDRIGECKGKISRKNGAFSRISIAPFVICRRYLRNLPSSTAILLHSPLSVVKMSCVTVTAIWRLVDPSLPIFSEETNSSYLPLLWDYKPEIIPSRCIMHPLP